MAKLTLHTVEEKNLQKIIRRLKDSAELWEDGVCPLCNGDLEAIGGFIPHEGKVAPICNKISCVLSATYAVMKFNGNGSPIID